MSETKIITMADYARRQEVRVYPRKPFAGLPFVSKEVNEYGWPLQSWQVDPAAADLVVTGEEYGHLAFETMLRARQLTEHAGELFIVAQSLNLTLGGMFDGFARRIIKGGKGSRSLTKIESGFLYGIASGIAGLPNKTGQS